MCGKERVSDLLCSLIVQYNSPRISPKEDPLSRIRELPISGVTIAALAISVAFGGAQTKEAPTKPQAAKATGAKAAAHAMGMKIWTSDQAEWMDCAGLPPGCKIKVANGDPSKGPPMLTRSFLRDMA